MAWANVPVSVATGLIETSGPTVLSAGTIADAGVVVRSGSTLITVAPSTATKVLRSDGSVWASTKLVMTDITGLSANGSIPVWSGSAWVDSQRGTAQGAVRGVGVEIANTTEATSGVTAQWSPTLALRGTAWNTSASVICGAEFYVTPVSAATPYSYLYVDMMIGASRNNLFSCLYSSGAGIIYTGEFSATKAVTIGGDLTVGASSTVRLTNATVSAGSSAATLANAPAATAQSGWWKIYVGTTAMVVPYWAAA
jgi:hypothetical protein